ncbi:uncharacterized protein MYCFIDRAFT_207828 [Pseudocercospora fijiensis CIRAD86]|uniref:Uncharacterized protein n=1 Tax=Pseudocercospora fijiensis (strain CIRAD86) TaxID=383855 RepID=M3AG28_PSEFD|nr:uncharacterized protein MYCFIDRAFT_207828 [Pseudocercospora fijiensis CIRAD86]EME83546.1 hypothetical protein MYCFIDRAFT_207828 [Pseudocercospora fijiensis CIRAD86]
MQKEQLRVSSEKWSFERRGASERNTYDRPPCLSYRITLVNAANALPAEKVLLEERAFTPEAWARHYSRRDRMAPTLAVRLRRRQRVIVVREELQPSLLTTSMIKERRMTVISLDFIHTVASMFQDAAAHDQALSLRGDFDDKSTTICPRTASRINPARGEFPERKKKRLISEMPNTNAETEKEKKNQPNLTSPHLPPESQWFEILAHIHIICEEPPGVVARKAVTSPNNNNDDVPR